MLRLGTVAILAVLALVLGASEHAPTPAIAGRTTATGTAVNYVGSTSQGLPVSFVATPTLVEAFRFAWEARCADGRTHTNTIVLGPAVIRSQAFSESGVLNTGGKASAWGRVLGPAASGEVARSGSTAFGTDCTDAGVRWQAHRVA